MEIATLTPDGGQVCFCNRSLSRSRFPDPLLASLVIREDVLAACEAAILAVLTHLKNMCEKDDRLEEALRRAQLVANGSGKRARVSELFDPDIE